MRIIGGEKPWVKSEYFRKIQLKICWSELKNPFILPGSLNFGVFQKASFQSPWFRDERDRH